jgi:hypothetical protein
MGDLFLINKSIFNKNQTKEAGLSPASSAFTSAKIF